MFLQSKKIVLPLEKIYKIDDLKFFFELNILNPLIYKKTDLSMKAFVNLLYRPYHFLHLVLINT